MNWLNQIFTMKPVNCVCPVCDREIARNEAAFRSHLNRHVRREETTIMQSRQIEREIFPQKKRRFESQ